MKKARLKYDAIIYEHFKNLQKYYLYTNYGFIYM